MPRHIRLGRVWVERLKGSLSTDQPISGTEQRAIKRYLATRDDSLPWVFLSERGGPMARQNVNAIVGRGTRSLASRACIRTPSQAFLRLLPGRQGHARAVSHETGMVATRSASIMGG
jgi:integrase